MPGYASHKKPLLAFLAVLVVTSAIVGKGFRADAIFGPAVTLTVPVLAAQSFAQMVDQSFAEHLAAQSVLEQRREVRDQAALHVGPSRPAQKLPAALPAPEASADRQEAPRASSAPPRPTAATAPRVRSRSPLAGPVREGRRVASASAPVDRPAVRRHRDPAPVQTDRSNRPSRSSQQHSGRSEVDSIVRELPRLEPNSYARTPKSSPHREDHQQLPRQVARRAVDVGALQSGQVERPHAEARDVPRVDLPASADQDHFAGLD